MPSTRWTAQVWSITLALLMMSLYCKSEVGPHRRSRSCSLGIVMDALSVFVEYAEKNAGAGSSVKMTVSYVLARARPGSDGLHCGWCGARSRNNERKKILIFWRRNRWLANAHSSSRNNKKGIETKIKENFTKKDNSLRIKNFSAELRPKGWTTNTMVFGIRSFGYIIPVMLEPAGL